MRKVRPTLKVIKQLPREAFDNATAFDQVARLANASREAREQILSELRLYRVQHPLIHDANSYFSSSRFPDRHKLATAARSRQAGRAQPVYEVRSRTGAAWRGGVITDEAGDPWLAYANTHDEFHSSAPKIFADPVKYMPTSIDIKVRDLEEERFAREEEDIACLVSLIDALSQAVQMSPEKHSAKVEVSTNTSFNFSFAVDLDAADTLVDTAHDSLCNVSVAMEIDVRDATLRERILRLYLPLLQPDSNLREQVYGQDRTTMHVSILMSLTQLAQVLVESDCGDHPQPAIIPDPTIRHYVEKLRLADAFVYGEPLQGLCGTWIVPTRDGDLATHLPVCRECLDVEPVLQRLLNHERGN